MISGARYHLVATYPVISSSVCRARPKSMICEREKPEEYKITFQYYKGNTTFTQEAKTSLVYVVIARNIPRKILDQLHLKVYSGSLKTLIFHNILRPHACEHYENSGLTLSSQSSFTAKLLGFRSWEAENNFKGIYWKGDFCFLHFCFFIFI